MATKGGTSSVVDSLRQLFARGDYEGVVQRAEQHLKKRRGGSAETAGGSTVIVEATLIAALIHLGRGAEAVPKYEALLRMRGEDKRISHFLKFVKPYLAWTGNGSVTEALESVHELKGNDARKLEAQLLYRLGRYDESAKVYDSLLEESRTELEEKKKPAAMSRWTLRAAAQAAPVTAAELETLSQTVSELATNLMATLVLSDKPEEAMALKDGVPSSYEVEYNSTCASIGANDFGMADISLEKAEKLLHAEGEEDEDIDEEMAPVRVQRAYLKHLSGSVVEAKNEYATIVKNKSADAASLAVAANNLTVALGQLAFDKEVQEMEQRKSAKAVTLTDSETDGGSSAQKVMSEKKAEKERHAALGDGLKKMRATSGSKVESKLTNVQRRAMSRNRSILLVQMGRLDGCKQELDRLKTAYPDDQVNALIEATLLARRGNLQAADEALKSAGDSEVILAARVQLAEDHGDQLRAAELLTELFPKKPAAIATAATLFEATGEKERAVALLREAAKDMPNSVDAKKALAELLMRVENYEEAAKALEDVLRLAPSDSITQAELIVATSYFNPERAEELSQRLPPVSSGAMGAMTGEELEKMPPPKRRAAKAATGLEYPEKVEETKEKKKRKRKKRLPKNYDPDGPPPDPERWLPKTQRSGYKKKNRKRNEVNFRGSQGADAASAEAAAVKNAERSAAKARAAEEEANRAPVNHRPKGAKAKKKKRKA